MYPNDGKQNYPFCTLKLSILKLKQPTNKYLIKVSKLKNKRERVWAPAKFTAPTPMLRIIILFQWSEKISLTTKPSLPFRGCFKAI